MTTATTMKVSVLRRLTCLGLGILTWSCTAPPSPSASPAGGVSQISSYDGHYQGTVQATAAGSGIDPAQCATDSRIAFDVSNGRFVYDQTHPRVAGTSPGLTAANTTTAYTATIAPNGTFSGGSERGGTIFGTIKGSHMNGDVQGLLCRYSFFADRI